MKPRRRWTAAFYLAFSMYVVLQNLESTTIISPVSSKPVIDMKGASIPLAYLSNLPEVQQNGGVIPEAIRSADAVPYVVEVHRGWPVYFQNEYGYRYEIENPAAHVSLILSGFPKPQGIAWSRLLLNFACLTAVAVILHLSIVFLLSSLRIGIAGQVQNALADNKAVSPSGGSGGF